MQEDDLLVVNKAGDRVAVLLFQRGTHWTPAEAASWRAIQIDYEKYFPAAFDLLVTGGDTYVWTDHAGSTQSDQMPDAHGPTSEFLNGYLDSPEWDVGRMYEDTLSYMTRRWLREALDAEARDQEVIPGWLRATGFGEAIRGGRVRELAAV